MDATYWQALGERAVKAGPGGKLEWRPRMQAAFECGGEDDDEGPSDALGTVLAIDCDGRLWLEPDEGPAGFDRGWYDATGMVPNLRDDATLGAYVAAIRERADDETLTCVPIARGPNGPVFQIAWLAPGTDEVTFVSRRRVYETRAEAWVAFAEWLKGQGR